MPMPPGQREAEACHGTLTPRTFTGSKPGREEANRYQQDDYIFQVGARRSASPPPPKALSHQDIPKVSVPRYPGWRDLLRWSLQENLPGAFPLQRASIPFKRKAKTPRGCLREKAGRKRTNRRFHYVSGDMPPSAVDGL